MRRVGPVEQVETAGAGHPLKGVELFLRAADLILQPQLRDLLHRLHVALGILGPVRLCAYFLQVGLRFLDRTQRDIDERFIEVYRRLGPAPFKEAVYSPGLTPTRASQEETHV